MENIRCNVLVYMRKTNLKKNGKAALFLRVTINGKRWDSALNMGIDPKEWDAKKEKATGENRDSNLVNETVESAKYRVQKIKLSLENEGKLLTLDGIKAKFLDKDLNSRTLLDLFQKHNEESKQKIGVQIAYATYERYMTCYNHLKEFLKKEYKANDLPVYDINKRLYEKFELFLKKDKKCAHNTSVKYIMNLNKIVRIAVDQGWIPRSPYKDMKYRLEEIDKPYLTKEELDLIIEKKIEIKRLDTVRDVFVFCCHTGLAFSDIKELTEENLKPGVDKQMWIIKKRKKTNVISRIPLLNPAAKIIEKYKDSIKTGNPDVLLPVPSNQKMNSYLKEIADISGITKILTTHTARRTFASTIMLQNGVNMEAVSKMLGHTSLFMTRKYAKVDEFFIAQETEKIRRKFSQVHI